MSAAGASGSEVKSAPSLIPPARLNDHDAGVYPGIFPPGVVPTEPTPCDVAQLAKDLYESMKGLGTNDSKLIECVARHTRQQRVEAAAEYEKQFKRRLSDAIRGDTSFWYCKLLLRLCVPREEMLAFIVFDATDGFGTKDDALIDVMTQFPAELPRAAAAYSRMYHVALKDAVIGDCSGDYRKLLVACLDTPRDAPGTIREEYIETDAQALYDAGEAILGTKEEVFINIFTQRSAEHLQRVNEIYPKFSKKKRNLKQAVESETSGGFRDALISLMTPTLEHFAHRIYKAMKGVGTNDTILVNAFTCLEKPVLLAVSDLYTKLFDGRKMKEDLLSDTSGNYRNLLLALLDTSF